MGRLAAKADILTPNLTEASILLGIEWPGEDITDAKAEEMVRNLLALGAKNVILKGIHRAGENVVRNFVGSFDENGNLQLTQVQNDYLPYALHGTGDVYCSCVMAAVMAGKNCIEAADFAGKFVHAAIEISTKQPEFQARGVSFEPLLGQVSDLLK